MFVFASSIAPIAITSSILAILNAPFAAAHDPHSQAPLDPNEKDWATRHMQIEHHIENFDPRSFFTLHDYDSDGYWEESEISRTYGLENEESYTEESQQTKKNITEEEKDKAIDKVMELFDLDEDGLIDMDEWMEAIQKGKRLPDFGFGPGHHGDDEYEYEIHHFEKYHNPDSPEEEFNHPEDARHMRKHEDIERDFHSQANLDKLAIVDANIPAKFRRDNSDKLNYHS